MILQDEKNGAFLAGRQEWRWVKPEPSEEESESYFLFVRASEVKVKSFFFSFEQRFIKPNCENRA